MVSLQSELNRDGSQPFPRGCFCVGCNYNLFGLSSQRCPECGRQFDPTDGSSFTIHPLSRNARFILCTRNWTMLLMVSLATAFWLASYCMPGQASGCCALCALLWLIVILLAGAQFVLVYIYSDRYYLRPAIRLNWRPTARAGIVLALVLALNWTGWPARLVFRFSRPALERTARSLYATRGMVGPQWIGLYNLDGASFLEAEFARARKRGGGTFIARGVCFEPDEDSVLNDTWLVYCPDGDLADLPRNYRDDFTALGGGWYEWR